MYRSKWPLIVLFVLIFPAWLYAAPQTLDYTYDELGRLTFVKDNVNGNRDYDYDAAGNRCAVSAGVSSDSAADCDSAGASVPAKPSGLRLTGPFSQIGGYTASWNAVSGATHYEVRFQSGGKQTVTALSISSTPRPHSVSAINANGSSSRAYF